MPTNYQNAICQNCPYCNAEHLPLHLRSTPLCAEENKSNTLLVFQAPGINEWNGNAGTVAPAPIISENAHSAAARIRNAFNRIQRKRSSYAITEVVQCYPGRGANNRDKKPLHTAIKQCQNHLLSDIQKNSYCRIISFGKVANDTVDSILNSQNIHIQHIKLPHPSSGKLSNTVLDHNLK